MNLSEEYFRDSLAKQEKTNSPENTGTYRDIFESYNHDITTPIKDRSEIFQFMNEKYVRRIEIYYSETMKILY